MVPRAADSAVHDGWRGGIGRATVILAQRPSPRSQLSTLPARMALTPSGLLLRLSDDLLEHIVSLVIAREEYGGGRSLKALELSHTCRRLRKLVIARASFWTNLEMHSKTHPELIYLILQRSRELPLHIDVSGIDPGEQILDEDTRLITSDLLEALRCTMPRFAGSSCIQLLGVNNAALVGLPEHLAVALETNPPAAQQLDICATPCDPLLGLFGPRLTYLDLREVNGFSLQWLGSILQLAPNLENFRLNQPSFTLPKNRIGDLDSFRALKSSQLQSLDIDIFEQDDFEAVMNVIERIHPSIISAGRRILLASFDDGSSVLKLDLQRFTHADRLVIDGRVNYTVKFLDPVESDDDATDSDNDVIRGFQCWPQSLHDDGPYLTVVSHIASTVPSVELRGIGVKDGVSNSELFLEGIAQISWPCLEHLTLMIFVDAVVSDEMIFRWPDAPQRTYIPRLETLDIVLRAGWVYADRETETADNWDPFRECCRASEAILSWFDIPDSVDTNLVVEIDGEVAPVSFSQKVLETMRKATGPRTRISWDV